MTFHKILYYRILLFQIHQICFSSHTSKSKYKICYHYFISSTSIFVPVYNYFNHSHFHIDWNAKMVECCQYSIILTQHNKYVSVNIHLSISDKKRVRDSQRHGNPQLWTVGSQDWWDPLYWPLSVSETYKTAFTDRHDLYEQIAEIVTHTRMKHDYSWDTYRQMLKNTITMIQHYLC